DWDSASAVLEKVREELAELHSAIEANDRSAVDAEIGDLLFALSSLGRHLDLQAEDALQRASDRFIRRFRYMERRLSDRQQDIHTTSVADLNGLWEEAKRDEGQRDD